MCLASIDKTMQVCALSTRSIAPSVSSYVTARAAPALSSALSPLLPHSSTSCPVFGIDFPPSPLACMHRSYTSTSDASLKTVLSA